MVRYEHQIMKTIKANLKELGGAYREIIGGHYPAMAMVQVVALMEAQAKVEIEATAVVREDVAP